MARMVQQEEGYQSHARGQDNTDGEGDLWRNPGANEGLSKWTEHDGKRDGGIALILSSRGTLTVSYEHAL
jgi:hypothetical protein